MSDRQDVLKAVAEHLTELAGLITELADSGEARGAPEAKKTETKSVAKKKPKSEPEKKKVTYNDVVKACSKKYEEGKRDDIVKLAKKYGIEKISSLEEDDLESFLSEVEAIV